MVVDLSLVNSSSDSRFLKVAGHVRSAGVAIGRLGSATSCRHLSPLGATRWPGQFLAEPCVGPGAWTCCVTVQWALVWQKDRT